VRRPDLIVAWELSVLAGGFDAGPIGMRRLLLRRLDMLGGRSAA